MRVGEYVIFDFGEVERYWRVDRFLHRFDVRLLSITVREVEASEADFHDAP